MCYSLKMLGRGEYYFIDAVRERKDEYSTVSGYLK